VNQKDLTGQNLGRYHIIEPLGQGGMASVYKAYDTSLERNVAIKIIRADIEEDDKGDFLKCFQREAHALAHLDHPYILKILDYGEQDGIPYLVMPFVSGGTLKEKLGVAMPFQQAAALLAPIARALEFAHAQKIIHRDVKPANILISQSGAPQLSDFGIAKIIAGKGSTRLTTTGVGIGTPDYMAPEQWLGTADPGTDIYSLGVVLFEMITGHRPFIADTPAAVMFKHMLDPLPRPTTFVADLPEVVEQVLLKALAKEPETRYQSMSAFATALEKLEQGEANIRSPILQDIETLIGTEKTVQTSAVNQATTNSRITAAPKKTETWMIALAAAAGLAILGLLCVLASGAFFVSRSLLNPKQSTAVAGAATRTSSSGEQTTNQAASPVPFPTLDPFIQQMIASPQPTPTALQSIAGFPEDIPFLKENNGDLTTTVEKNAKMYFFTSNLSQAELTDFYMKGMAANNWKFDSTTTSDAKESEITLYFSKSETNDVSITLMKWPKVTRVVVRVGLPLNQP
jgi:serine/threonine protein kinase